MVLPLRYGHIHKMALKVKEGVDSVAGAEGVLYQVKVFPGQALKGDQGGQTVITLPNVARPALHRSPSRGPQPLCTYTAYASRSLAITACCPICFATRVTLHLP